MGTSEFRREISAVLKTNKEKLSSKKRDLSPSVQTRFYRSPEVILMDKSYGQAADIWSVGLILAELMQILENGGSNHKKCLAFIQGNSCYPISPANKNEDEVHRKDQFIEMMKRFRDHDFDQDFSFLNSSEQEMYTKEIIGVSEASNYPNLSEAFQNCSSEL